ncbi:MAG: PQQ-binding-like beta-propeller repeat protein [Alphaproteobacteria bacterium]|nr:PQQ-binding-like beta-propeller repeat protein [Alphaproteobacteria bacterium]MBV9063642.1 PQQ-binding-like beta-propeller repeat protein [Alphaproteobacteria bacterium]
MTSRLVGAALLLTVPSVSVAEDSVVTYHNGNSRHGAYVVPTLTLDAAVHMQRDTGFTAAITGHVYAQPLYWKPKGAKRGLVIVATESNNVYALDDRNGATVWQRSLGAPAGHNELGCGNIDPVGVTGTPVIDPAAQVLYLAALMHTNNGPKHKVFALSLGDGSILSGWPLDMETELGKQGATFSSTVQGERSALLIYANRLFVNYAGNWGDCGTYYGTVAQINPANPSLEANWQTRAKGGGIWAQGGLAGDGTYLFVTTGNTFGANSWSDGEAIIRLHPGLARHDNNTKDYFAPSNWQQLDNSDQDLGGTEALPFNIGTGGKPAKRVIAFGKDGKAYLVNRGNLGGIGGQLESVQVAGGGIRTAPAIYETATGTMVAFTNSGSSHCSGGNVAMLNIAASGSPLINFAWCAALNGGGAPIVTTTDGTANAIVWAIGAEGDNALHGYDAKTGNVVFSGNGTQMTGLHHFQTILATRNRFYVGADNNVYAFKWR